MGKKFGSLSQSKGTATTPVTQRPYNSASCVKGLPAPVSASPETLLELRDVDFGYGDRLVLSNLNLLFKRGPVVAVMGGSGCGETTVLRLIGGLVRAQRGQILFHRQDTGPHNPGRLHALRLP